MTSSAQAETYRLDLGPICSRSFLTANQRLHWAQRASRTRHLRATSGWLARAHNLPKGHLTVGLEYAPGDRRKRDGGENLAPTLKPCIDGLVDAGLVPDDTPEHVERDMPVILPPPHPPGMWLTVRVAPG